MSSNTADSVVDWLPLAGRIGLLMLRLRMLFLCVLRMCAPGKESQCEIFPEKVALEKDTPFSYLAISMHMWASTI